MPVPAGFEVSGRSSGEAAGDGQILSAGKAKHVLSDVNMNPQSKYDSHALLELQTGLEEQQRELQQVIRKAENEIRALADSGPLDSVDLSCSSSFKDLVFARNTQIIRQLRLVDRALERIRRGDFGACDDCEGAIGLKRLQAVPWATYCIECQERVEQGQRHAAAAF
jgi:DnaK suppressor protein